MIAYISGTIIHKLPGTLIVTANSIGYEIHVPSQYLEIEISQKIDLVIYHHITEQSSSLFGFKTWEERAWFITLISISGIGPKVALSILSSGTSDDIAKALQKNDKTFFNNISGIGSKTATRIIVELKNVIPTAAEDNQGELLEALTALGYTRKEVEPLITKVDSSLPIEKQIASVLKKI